MTTKPNQSIPTNKSGRAAESGLARFGLALANWSERWFPDPLVFAFAGVIIVFIFGLLIHQPASKLAIAGGKSFWSLVPFTMQMVMIIIGGYVVASTPLVNRFIRWLATIPKNGRTAVAMIALFSMLTSLISWGLSLIFSGLLTREMARRVKGMDYRAAGGAAYLGLGAIWALGLSSSAAMLMATKSAIPPSLLAISGLIPLGQTIFLWQGMLTALILIVVSVAVAYLSAPSAQNATHRRGLRDQYESADRPLEPRTKPGEWLEYSPLLTVLVALYLGWYLLDFFRSSPQGALAVLDLNTYNLLFITVGLLAALASQALYARGCRVHSRHRRRADSVSVLCGHLRHDRRHRNVRMAGQPVCPNQHPADLSPAGGVLLGAAGRLRALGRKQVGHRSALHSAGRQPSPRPPGMGGADLQRLRGAAQPDKSILDAAACWAF